MTRRKRRGQTPGWRRALNLFATLIQRGALLLWQGLAAIWNHALRPLARKTAGVISGRSAVETSELADTARLGKNLARSAAAGAIAANRFTEAVWPVIHASFAHLPGWGRSEAGLRRELERRFSDVFEEVPRLVSGTTHQAPRPVDIPDYQPLADMPGVDPATEPADGAGGETPADDADHRALIADTLEAHRISAEVSDRFAGPVVTTYGIVLGRGQKLAPLAALEDEFQQVLGVARVRIEPMPERGFTALELPSSRRLPVRLLPLLAATGTVMDTAPPEGLATPLGVDPLGQPVIVDLATFPHALVAGTTGSGKSAGIAALLAGLLARYDPRHLQLILVDPKQVEFPVFDAVPHLLHPVITDMDVAVRALHWTIAEMERRFTLLKQAQVTNLGAYNRLHGAAPLPRILLVVDELADLMATHGREVEPAVVRIAQKSRAAGIHLLLATQRPSVDVVTGLIKSNIPTRIAYSVATQADSMTILGAGGAHKLLGRGDMLLMRNGSPVLERVHGAYIPEDRLRHLTDRIRALGQPDYIDLGSTPLADS